MSYIKIGWAQTSITPDRPVYNGGQIYPRISKYVHDPLTATALALDNGQAQAILVSLDLMCCPEPAVTAKIRERLSLLDGFNPQYLSLSVTHTHNSIHPVPFLFQKDALDILGAERIALPDKPQNLLEGEEMNAFLIDRVVRVATDAWESRKEGGVSSAADYAAIAFNRRPVFEKNGASETQMYGVAARSDFKRYEAGSDHSADMLYTWDTHGNLTGVAVCIPCPSQVFELHSFLSADYWHYTRSALRERLGNVFVLPLCGAAGDQNPLDLTRISKHNARELEAWGAQAGEVLRNFDMADECRDIADRISDAVVRGLRKARNHIDRQPVFLHETNALRLPIRQVTEADYFKARSAVEKARARFSPEAPMQGTDLVAVFEPMGVVGRWFEQTRDPFANVPLHFFRLNDLAMATCPFELFIEFSLRVKARAKSPQTAVVQMTDDYLDYLPTQAAVAGGSYSSAPASTTCGPESGDALIEQMLEGINKMWEN